MKNTFAVTITLLLALTLGGSFLAYKKATHHEAKPAAAAEAAAPEAAPAATGTDTGKAEGATGEAPSETATAAAAGAAAGASTEAAAPAGDAEAGKAKFAGSCAGCHGANAEGGVGPALKIANAWTLEQFAAAVREGKAPSKTLSAVMPKFTTDMLSDEDLANIDAYVRTLN